MNRTRLSLELLFAAAIILATAAHIATVYADRPTWPWRHIVERAR